MSISRYETLTNGDYEYVLEVDIQDFLPSQLQVTLTDYSLLICAERGYRDGQVFQDFRREVQLPLNVRTTGVRARYINNGILEIRAPVYYQDMTLIRSGISAPSTNYITIQNADVCYPPRSRSVTYECTPVRSRSMLGLRSSRSRSPVKIVYDLEPVNSNYVRQTEVIKTMSSCPSTYQHRIELDTIFRPEHLSIMVDNGIVYVNASVDRDPRCLISTGGQSFRDGSWSHREFRCEHTLPGDVDSSCLRAELVTGCLILRAPYRSGPYSTGKARIVYEVPIRGNQFMDLAIN
ncbi:hypothetical protein Ciccas_007576 [Cichlidogyrus casuarinus]|uniref:SHSP domain-containing protein n=1 Tax=Cichlidogyrus casuarinus TaxID=1844966 RepID=A0ABD2Q2I0_9PLAT